MKASSREAMYKILLLSLKDELYEENVLSFLFSLPLSLCVLVFTCLTLETYFANDVRKKVSTLHITSSNTPC